jgi:hypothetical protein
VDHVRGEERAVLLEEAARNDPFGEFPLRSSRAYLGKTIIFRQKVVGQKTVSAPDPERDELLAVLAVVGAIAVVAGGDTLPEVLRVHQVHLDQGILHWPWTQM